MEFKVLRWQDTRSEPGAYLVIDNWDDFGIKTMFTLWYSDGIYEREIGPVKIGRSGLGPGPRVGLPDAFEALDDDCFSLGQDASYYENLRELGTEIRTGILTALRDVAFDVSLFTRFRPTEVMESSLLRSVHPSQVTGQFARIAHGGATRALYEFTYRWPAATSIATPAPPLEFSVYPQSHPPTNIHALIGSNGVGKTRLLRQLAYAVTFGEAARYGTVCAGGADTPVTAELFANLVMVSFSAFDRLPPLHTVGQQQNADTVKATQVTLYDDRARTAPLTSFSPAAETYGTLINEEFITARRERWEAAVAALGGDPLFSAADVVEGSIRGQDGPKALFDSLSSGHKIVLLAVTQLAVRVAERTLVLIDEPETHLHPPLLAAFIKAVSDLLVDRNGVAIIATHSPVVLQEIPSDCVYMLRRSGDVVAVERPLIETYGENVGVLTREVFGLEVRRTGFHQQLADAVDEGLSFERVLDRFGHRLGREAQAITRTLISSRDRRNRPQPH